MMEEKIFYNAVAIMLFGDPAAVRRVKRKSGDLFGWKEIYESLASRANNGENGDEGHVLLDPDHEWEKLEKAGVKLIFQNESEFPEPLRHIPNPPFGIYVRGELPAGINENCFSIVGTRRATPEGKSITKKFASTLAQAGFIIVSGLALGIDAAAHEGCLDAGGKTVATLAGGLDDIYPGQNENLGNRILAAGGALISEYPVGEPPLAHRFLERNRLVSGLSRGVLIVECPENSGSRVTGRLALEQNRDVFIVPGPISHSNFVGSHQLIRQGAELVTKPEEILEEYNLVTQTQSKNFYEGIDAEEKQVLLALRSESHALEVDKIIEMTKLEPRIANRTLSYLILKNVIKETDAGYIIE